MLAFSRTMPPLAVTPPVPEITPRMSNVPVALLSDRVRVWPAVAILELKMDVWAAPARPSMAPLPPSVSVLAAPSDRVLLSAISSTPPPFSVALPRPIECAPSAITVPEMVVAPVKVLSATSSTTPAETVRPPAPEIRPPSFSSPPPASPTVRILVFETAMFASVSEVSPPPDRPTIEALPVTDIVWVAPRSSAMLSPIQTVPPDRITLPAPSAVAFSASMVPEVIVVPPV